MATPGRQQLPQHRQHRRPHGPERSIARVANILSKKKPELDDIPFFEGNLPTGTASPRPSTRCPPASSASSTRASPAARARPSSTTRPAASSRTRTSSTSTSQAERQRRRVPRLRGGPLHRGMAQTMANAVFYESAATNPERIHGLSPATRAPPGSSVGLHPPRRRCRRAAASAGQRPDREVSAVPPPGRRRRAEGVRPTPGTRWCPGSGARARGCARVGGGGLVEDPRSPSSAPCPR